MFLDHCAVGVVSLNWAVRAIVIKYNVSMLLNNTLFKYFQF